MCTDYDPESCARCYSFWCLGFGAILLAINVALIILISRGSQPILFGEPAILIVQFAFGILTALASIIAGILLLLGMSRDNRKLFRVGKIMSYIAPIVYFYLIFPIVVLVIGVLNLSEYRDERWP